MSDEIKAPVGATTPAGAEVASAENAFAGLGDQILAEAAKRAKLDLAAVKTLADKVEKLCGEVEGLASKYAGLRDQVSDVLVNCAPLNALMAAQQPLKDAVAGLKKSNKSLEAADTALEETQANQDQFNAAAVKCSGVVEQIEQIMARVEEEQTRYATAFWSVADQLKAGDDELSVRLGEDIEERLTEFDIPRATPERSTSGEAQDAG